MEKTIGPIANKISCINLDMVNQTSIGPWRVRNKVVK